MNLELFKDFLLSYSLPTIIIAIVVALINILIRAIFKDKLSLVIKNYLPFILSVPLYFAFDMITKKAFVFSSDAFYAGILSGSLSTIIKTAIDRISQGKTIGLSATALLIESLLKGFIDEKSLTATARTMDNIIAQNQHLDNGLEKELIEILNTTSKHNLTDEQVENLVNLIIFSVDATKKSK